MNTLGQLKSDEKGMMVFAMLAVVILLVSIFAGAYFAGIRSKSQRNIVDLAELEELERKIEKIERELENVAQESGYLAVESVKENIESDFTLRGLKNRVGKRTTEIFEDHFEQSYSKKIQSGNLNLHLHLRPIEENRTNVEFTSLYLKEEGVDEESWSEIPGFFKIKRTVHANIENSRTGSFSSRSIEIEREVNTDFFILAERMQNFDPVQVRKMVDCMLSGYLNLKVYDLGFEEDVGFKKSFVDTFQTQWLEEYESGDFGGGQKRENLWKENSTGFVDSYTRDEGKISRESLISEEEFIHISKLALLLEQIRAFRTYDESLLYTISDYFETQDKTILELIGEGRNNKVNLHGLVINLFQEKGVLSNEMFLPDMFLNRITEDGILSIIEDNEEWTETSFWMMNDLVKGEIDDQEPWRYEDFAENTNSVSELNSRQSYLKVLFTIYSNSMNEVLKSFKVNSEEVERFVTEEIKKMEPLYWMEDLSIVGEEGIDQITRSILHQAKNLSMSFGFEEGSYDNTASPFFYMYFLNNWGIDEEEKDIKVVAEEIDNDGIHLGVQDKVKGELRSRAQGLENTAKDLYEEIIISIERFNETEWYEGEKDQNEVWESLNKTFEPLLRLKEDQLFEEREAPYISQSLKSNHDELEERIDYVEEKMLALDREARDYTEKILKMLEEYPEVSWKYETYEYLYEEGGGNELKKYYLNLTNEFLTASAEELTGSYNWSLEGYQLADHIDPGEKPDQSIGYRAIGSFTQEMIREFESPSPLDHSNSRDLFRLINQNLFDLKGARETEQKSRLMSILRGEGDPLSENLGKDDLSAVSFDFSEKMVNSSHLDDIDRWWDEDALEYSISSLESIRTELNLLSYRMIDQNVREKPYSDYADASFYMTADDFLDSLIQSMSEYSRAVSSKTKGSGFTYGVEDGFSRVPVISAPRGKLTLHESSSLEDPGFSRSVQLEVEMDHKKEEVIRLQKISDTNTRAYEGEISESQEWINPLSSRYSDHYSTALFVEYSTSEMEIQLSSEGDTKLVSEMYSHSDLTGKFDRFLHSSFTEVVTPVPLLEKKYSPRPVSTPSINDVSLNRNVFNGTENKTELTLEIEKEKLSKDRDIMVEVLKRRNLSTFEPRAKRGMTNLQHILDDKGDHIQKTLLSEHIPFEEIDGNVINLEFDLEGIEFPDEEVVLDHMVVRIRSEIELGYMEGSRDLHHATYFEGEVYSFVPSYSTSEQMYLYGEEKSSHLEVFRVENGNEFPHNGFDLVTGISSDSWVIRKNGFRYLVDFENDPLYRDLLSGTYTDSNQDLDDLLIDPRSDLSEDRSITFSFIPENEYGYLVKNDFVPLYMGVSENNKNFYPDRMMPLTVDMDEIEWNSLHATLRKNGYTLSLEKDGNPYLYYDLYEFNGPKIVDSSFERTKRSLKDFYQNEASSTTDSPTDISQSGIEILEKMDMIDNFTEKDISQKRSLFLAANFSLSRVQTAEKLTEEYDNFTLGSITKSLDVIGEDETEILLEWLEEERESSRDMELRAFLSFDESFIKELSNITDDEDYEDALDSLDKKFEDMPFVEYRVFCINDLSDIESLEYLQDDFKSDPLSTITGAGLRPSAIEELHISYKIDLERFAESIENFSTSNQFPSVVREVNSGEFERAISLYMAVNLKSSRVEWMPFGEERPYLLIDGVLAHTSIRLVDSNSSVKEFVDESLKEAVFELPSERVVTLIEVKDESLSEVEIEEITYHIQERVEHHDPLYQNISWVHFRIDGETEFSYLHL